VGTESGPDLPDRLGYQDQVDWVPMDWAARSVCEIAVTKSTAQTTEATVAHIVNPRTLSWNSLVSAVLSVLGGDNLKIVSYKEWVDTLQKVSFDKEEIAKKPAVKLLEFFEELLSERGRLPALATVETTKMSDTMRDMQPVNEEMIRKWVTMWSN
jgi:hypothetical protein